MYIPDFQPCSHTEEGCKPATGQGGAHGVRSRGLCKLYIRTAQTCAGRVYRRNAMPMKDIRRAGEFATRVLGEVDERCGSLAPAWRVMDNSSPVLDLVAKILTEPHSSAHGVHDIVVNPTDIFDDPTKRDWSVFFKSVCKSARIERVNQSAGLFTCTDMPVHDWSERKVQFSKRFFDMDAPIEKVHELLARDGWRLAWLEEALMIAMKEPSSVWDTNHTNCGIFDAGNPMLHDWMHWPCFTTEIVMPKSGLTGTYIRGLSCFEPFTADDKRLVIPRGMYMICVRLR